MLGVLMPVQVHQRPATDSEKELLVAMLRNAPSRAQRCRQGVENALVLWAASLLALVVVWLVAAWVGRHAFDMEFGLRSDAAVWVLGIAAPVSAVHAVFSSVRWLRGSRGQRPLIQADVAAGVVDEARYAFTEIKRFQEPEHGGLIYFLLTVDDRVLTLFDHESQDLGVQGLDPRQSSFQPTRELVIVRAPKCGFVIDRRFLGEPLPLNTPRPLKIAPKHWPQADRYTDIAWEDLEAKL
jgi:hypothetical protein